MAVFLGSETEPSKSLDASLRDLRPIIEDSESLVRLASLEGLTEHFDFGYPQKPPKRSPTYPFASSGPSKAHISKSLGKNGHVNHNPQEHRVVPPIPKSEVHNEPSSTGLVGPPIRHSSTINTTNSASFEDTAVWDHKAILSLGKYPSQTLNSLHNCGFISGPYVQYYPLCIIVQDLWPSGLWQRIVSQVFMRMSKHQMS